MKSKPLNYLIYGLFFFALIFNLYFFIFPPNHIVSRSLSFGDRYYSRLSLWYKYAKDQNWTATDKIEPGLDPADIKDYKSLHHIDDIKQLINQISIKTDKNVEDWLELAKLQIKIGDKESAMESLSQAQKIDPIRDDIKQFYFQLSHD